MTNHTHTFQTLDDGTRLCFECDEKRPAIGGGRVKKRGAARAVRKVKTTTHFDLGDTILNLECGHREYRPAGSTPKWVVCEKCQLNQLNERMANE